MFSSTFFYALVVTALTWTALGALTLVILLLRDYKNGNLW